MRLLSRRWPALEAIEVARVISAGGSGEPVRCAAHTISPRQSITAWAALCSSPRRCDQPAVCGADARRLIDRQLLRDGEVHRQVQERIGRAVLDAVVARHGSARRRENRPDTPGAARIQSTRDRFQRRQDAAACGACATSSQKNRRTSSFDGLNIAGLVVDDRRTGQQPRRRTRRGRLRPGTRTTRRSGSASIRACAPCRCSGRAGSASGARPS